MKADQILYYVIFLLVGGLGGYWIGSKMNKPASDTPSQQAEAPAEKPADVPETATTNTAQGGSTETPTDATPASTPATTTPTPTSGQSLPTASKCFSGDQELETDLSLYASKIEAMKLMYDRTKLQDCSGIFYRLIDEFAKKKCDGYKYPDVNSARPARMIAQWYHDNKNFQIVNDPMVSRNQIKPGAVMFYGSPGKKVNNPSIADLTKPGGIFHVGVVTSVTRDDDGNVTQYTLFHGRSTGKIASRTYYHSIRGPSNLGQPILGVGSEEWVGMAYLFTPA